MPEFADTPIPYVPIADKATEVRAAIDVPQLSAANSFGGLQKLAIPGPFATDAEASTGGVPDDNLYYRSDGTVRAASHISLDLAFALDKTLTARTGPTPTFSRASSGLFVNANGILVGKTAGTTASITPSTTANGTSVTVAVASGSVVGWLVGQSVSLIVDVDGGNDNDPSELWLVGTIVSMTATELVFTVTEKTTTAGSATAWTLGYRGARFDHDPATIASKGLLIEEPRINYIVQSENFTSWWTASAGVVSRNKETVIPDPAGTFNSTRLEVNATFNLYRDPISASVPDGTRAISIFARAVTGGLNSIALLGTSATVRINLATGAVITNTGTVAGSLKVERFGAIGADGFNWWRISYATTDTTGDGFYIENVGTVSGAITAFLIFGAQYELGAFPTSYIPTTSGTAARSADVCSITGTDFSGFYNQSEGSVLVATSIQNFGGNNRGIWGINNNTASHGFLTYTDGALSGVLSQSRSVSATTLLGSFSPTAGVTFKRILAYYPSGCSISTNGSTIATTAVTNSTQTMLTIQVGNMLGGSFQGSCHIASLRYYRKRLSNEKLQALTAP